MDLASLLDNVTALTPLAIGLIALAGLVVGIAPSSFPLLSVAAGFAAGRAIDANKRRNDGLWLSAGFALGIVTMDALVGALFGLVGFAVLRALASVMAVAYGLLAIVLALTGLALLRFIRIPIPVLNPSAKPVRNFLGSFTLGLPFGLSTCPACTPLILPIVAGAASTADPVMGGVMMFTFGVARGIPIAIAGAAAGSLARLRGTREFVRSVERVGGVLLIAAALYFVYQAARYAGWMQAQVATAVIQSRPVPADVYACAAHAFGELFT